MAKPWKDPANKDLMDRIEKAQNKDWTRDIMTWAGMCDTREELQAHVERNEV